MKNLLLLGVVIFTMGEASFAQTSVYQEKSLLGLAQDLHLYSKVSMKGATVYFGNYNPVFLQVAPGEKSVEIQTIDGFFEGYADSQAVSSHLVNNPGQSLPVNVVDQVSNQTTEVSSHFVACLVGGHHNLSDKLQREVTVTRTYLNTHYVFSFLTAAGINFQFTGEAKNVMSTKTVNGPCS